MRGLFGGRRGGRAVRSERARRGEDMLFGIVSAGSAAVIAVLLGGTPGSAESLPMGRTVSVAVMVCGIAVVVAGLVVRARCPRVPRGLPMLVVGLLAVFAGWEFASWLATGDDAGLWVMYLVALGFTVVFTYRLCRHADHSRTDVGARGGIGS